LIACAVWPQISSLSGYVDLWWEGLLRGAIGWIVGYFGLWAVVEGGKKLFGKRSMKFDKEVEWFLREPTNDVDPMHFVIDGVEVPWWEIFFRKTDRLIVDATEVVLDGKETGAGQLVIRETGIELSDGRTFELENMVSLSGKARGAVIPREAMGKGDIHLLGMIGAFFGFSAVFLSLFAASIFALVAALIGRIGFGKPLPFGPFLAMGAVAWMFGGWRLWQMYMEFVGFN